MLAPNRRKSVIFLGLLVIIIIAIGATRNQKKESVDVIEVSFSESELDNLGESIEKLEFDDLVGFSGEVAEDHIEETPDVGLNELDLDKLGELLEGLQFEDLGGLTED